MSIRHDTKSSHSVNEENPETVHPSQIQPTIRGHFIPIEVWELAEKDIINWSELKLLLIIDSLVRSKGIGCWASLKHFASRLNLTSKHVSTIISRLKDLKLVRQLGTVTIRNLKYNLLETTWSRIFIEDEDFISCQERLEEILEKQTKLPVRIHIDEESFLESRGRLLKDPEGSIPEHQEGTLPKDPEHNKTRREKKLEEKENTVEGQESSTDARSARPVIGHPDREISEVSSSSKQTSGNLNGHANSYKSSKDINTSESSSQSARSAPLPRKKESDPVKELAQWFYAETKKKRLDSPTIKSLKGWIPLFLLQVQKIMERDILSQGDAICYIKTILTDHLSHSSDEWQPQAFCAKKIIEKWECIERQWRSRQGNKSSSNGHKPKKSQLFNKFTRVWFENLPEEYDHPTKPGVTVKVYSDGSWKCRGYKKVPDEEPWQKAGIAAEGDYPPLPKE